MCAAHRMPIAEADIVAGFVPAAPAGLPRAGLGADVLGTGAQARGSEGTAGVYVDGAPRHVNELAA